VKDAFFLFWIGLGAFVLYSLLNVLIWLSHALIIVGFIYFCWWFTRLPEAEKDQIRGRFYGVFELVRNLTPWRRL
jgi:threonine/homoserine/homoserine lactone efflux protein